jgi:hypothetical protein
MPTVETRGTDERFAIRRLVVDRGGGFVIAMLASYGVDARAIADVFFGRPIEDDVMKTLKKALKERCAHDTPKLPKQPIQ